MAETILQAPILTDFVYPFLIVFLILFAVLEYLKVFGDGKQQIHAVLSFVIGLVFVSAIYPKSVVENLALFLSVAIVVMFVFFILWNFLSQGDDSVIPEGMNKGVKIGLGVILLISLVVAVLWATGVQGAVYDFFVNQIWGSEFLTNLVFIVLVGAALALVIKPASGGKN